VLGVALHSTGRVDRAVATLEDAHERHPADRSILVALATINRDAGRPGEAIRWARRLVALAPEDDQAAALLASLEASGR